MNKSKPQLLVTVDVLHKKPVSFVHNGKHYKIEGSCIRCGKCCEGKCHWFDREPDGSASCLIHGRAKPWDCFLYPATRDPSNPLLEGCGYKIVEL